MSALLPDRAVLQTFLETLFRHADRDSFVVYKAFDAKNVAVFRAHGVRLGNPKLVEAAYDFAKQAATHGSPVTFCPPVATFKDTYAKYGYWRALSQDVADGLTISVDADKTPVAARSMLGELLGGATLESASGGLWADPETGELQERLHLHWRLKAPARTMAERQMLYEARKIATALVDADMTLVPSSHPLRWPGSVHNKGTPRLSRIVAITENEVDLKAAHALLKAAWGDKPFGEQRRTNSGEPTAERDDVVAAVERIPNDASVTWGSWKTRAMAIFAATGGEGFDIFDRWSARYEGKYDPEVTQAAWDAIVRSPPARLTAGSLFHAANQADPTWRKPSDLRRLLEKFETPAAPEPVAPLPAAAEDEPFSMPVGANVPVISEDEAGIAFAEEYRGKLRFSVSHGRWFVWDGQIWRENTTNLAFTLTREHIRKMAADHAEKVRIIAGRAAFAGAVERFARADRAFAVTADAWDQDGYLLGTPRGTVDLRTGELRPARPEDGITRCTAVAPADTADCPLWLRLMDETFAGDAATVRFFKQWAGYSLTGDTREQSLVFGHGDGGNGKGVTINTISRIAGTYTVTAAAETFVAAFGTRHSTELAMLAGARIVKASEMEKGQVWAEKRIKEITGGDEITARFMRQDNFTFLPAFKLIIIGNDIPDLNHVDDAMRRRFNLLPFHHKPSRPDPTLTQKLETEWPAILRWMIDGCLDWQRNGLVRPECVLDATREYLGDQDTLAHWAAENCTIERDNADLKEATVRLYGSWVSHAKAAGVGTGSEKAFSRDLRTRFRLRPREKIPLPSGSRVRGFSGIALRSASFDEEA